jgi:hypothetical protein
MDVLKMINELRAERSGIEEAIIVLERMAQSHGKRRGRPPAWLKAAASARAETGDAADAPKRVVSEATRRKMAIAQRKRHAAAKKADKSAAQG